jgi:hypothetical protein
MPEENKAILFVDGSNFYHELKALSLPTWVNFKKLGDLLCAQEGLTLS